jgi:hypothetical protein
MAFKLSATLHVEMVASDKAHADRDTKIKPFLDLEKPAGVHIYYDLFLNKVVTDELEKNKAGAEQRLVAEAKKLGLKPVGAPDLSYTIYGNEEGPIEFSYSIRAE